MFRNCFTLMILMTSTVWALAAVDIQGSMEDPCFDALLIDSRSAEEPCSFSIYSLGTLPELDTVQQRMLAAAYNNRALVRMHAGELDGAEADLANAMLLTPDDAALYLNRGNLRLRQGQFQAALADYDQTLALSEAPLPSVLHNKVLAHRALGELVEAEASLLRAAGHEVRVIQPPEEGS